MTQPCPKWATGPKGPVSRTLSVPCHFKFFDNDIAKCEDIAKYTGAKHEDLLHGGHFADIKWIPFPLQWWLHSCLPNTLIRKQGSWLILIYVTNRLNTRWVMPIPAYWIFATWIHSISDLRRFFSDKKWSCNFCIFDSVTTETSINYMYH